MTHIQDIEINEKVGSPVDDNLENKASHIPPFKFAFVLDETIVDIIYAEERVASLFLKNAVAVDVTEKIEELESLGLSLIDATYDSETEEFILASQY
jgi:hypothetical protein